MADEKDQIIADLVMLVRRMAKRLYDRSQVNGDAELAYAAKDYLKRKKLDESSLLRTVDDFPKDQPLNG